MNGVKLVSVGKEDKKKERKGVLVWECQHGGQIQQKQLSFDLCTIALGSALGLHFQRPATTTLGSERTTQRFGGGEIFGKDENIYIRLGF